MPFTYALRRETAPGVRPGMAGNFGVRITSLREVSGPPLREHLRAQMKVTRPPGRDPARRHEPIIERTKRKVRTGPQDDLHTTTAFHASRIARSTVEH